MDNSDRDGASGFLNEKHTHTQTDTQSNESKEGEGK